MKAAVLREYRKFSWEEKDIPVPVIVRLEGTNVEEGRKILQDSSLKFLVARDMSEAAVLVTEQVSG